MAVRFDAAADRLLRTTDLLDYNSAYTIMGHVQIVVDTNSNQTIWAPNAGATTDVDQLRTTTDGVTLETRIQTTAGGTQLAGSALTVGVWAHLASVRESTTSYKVYKDGVLDITNTRSVSGRTAATRLEVSAYTTGNTNPGNIRVAYLKAWSAALTIDEVVLEMRSVRPIRLTNLYGWWPLLPGSTERVRDYSGNGRAWTEGGTLTDEDPPPISWGGGRRSRWVAGFTRLLTTSVASLSSVNDSAAPKVARGLSDTRASLSSVNDSAASKVARALAASRSSASSVNDSAVAKVAHPLTTSPASASTVNDSAASKVARGLADSVASQSSVNDGAVGRVARPLSSSRSSTSSVNDSAVSILLFLRALATTVASASTVSDSAASKVARRLSTSRSSTSAVNDSAVGRVARPLSDSVASLSSVHDGAASAVGHGLTTSVASLSSVHDGAASNVIALAASIANLFAVVERLASSVIPAVGRHAAPAARRSFEALTMAVANVPKDPDEVVDYALDWTTVLDGDTIATSSWAADGGLTVDTDTKTSTSTTVRVSGGTLGRRYKLKNTITTGAGQTLVRRLVVVVQEM